jgi:hypothetical protein
MEDPTQRTGSLRNVFVIAWITINAPKTFVRNVRSRSVAVRKVETSTVPPMSCACHGSQSCPSESKCTHLMDWRAVQPPIAAAASWGKTYRLTPDHLPPPYSAAFLRLGVRPQIALRVGDSSSTRPRAMRFNAPQPPAPGSWVEFDKSIRSIVIGLSPAVRLRRATRRGACAGRAVRDGCDSWRWERSGPASRRSPRSSSRPRLEG